MTLQEILDAVLLECGMDTETVYATSSKDAVLRLVKLANRAARSIATAHHWQALVSTYTFSLTSATTYDLPSDWRCIVPDTTYTDSTIDPVNMRVMPGDWRYLQVNSSGSGPRYNMRVMGDKIHVYSPNSGDEISFEYISDHAVMDTDGSTTQKLFDADTDTWRLDDDLLIMCLVWRLKKLLGLPDWQVDIVEYKSYLRTTIGQDAPAKTIVSSDPGDYTLPEPHTDTWI